MYHFRFTTAVQNIISNEENQITLRVSTVIFLLYEPPHVAENIYNIFVHKNECCLKYWWTSWWKNDSDVQSGFYESLNKKKMQETLAICASVLKIMIFGFGWKK